MKVILHIDDIRLLLTNLFNGNRGLSNSFHKFINENSKEVFNLLKKDLEHELSKILIEIWNGIFNKLPIKYWLK